MPRSRILLSFSVALLAVTLIGAVGWCGGPVEPRQDRPSQSPQTGNMGDMAAASTGDAGFSASGGVGSGSASGSEGQDAWIPFNDLQLRGSTFWQGRLSAVIPGLESFRVVGDYSYASYQGGGTWTQILPNIHLIPGESFTAQLNVSLITVSADYLGGAFGSGYLVIGPRIQWAMLTDTLQINNDTRPAGSGTQGHNGSMIGFGLVGILDIGKMAGISMVSPKLNFSAQFGGGGSSMRYFNWEVALKVASTGLGGYGPMAPTASAEIAFARYQYKGTVDDNQETQFFQGYGPGSLPDRSSRPDVTYSVPMVRGILAF